MAEQLLADPVLVTATPPPSSEGTSGGGRRRRAQRRAGALSLRVLVILYVALLVAAPIGVLVWRTFATGIGEFLASISDPLAVHAFLVTAEVAGISVVLNTVLGMLAALLLTRHRFRGRRVLDALLGLPVSVSPIVVGLALVLVYGSSGWFGPALDSLGLQIILSLPGMVLATMFVSIPLVTRAVAPVLEQLGTEQEQAARSLGANALTRFRRVTLPGIRFALITGVVLAIARCVGEYGAVLIVSGNVQGVTETATLRVSNLYQTLLDPNAAYAVTFVLVAVAIATIVVTSLLGRDRRDRHSPRLGGRGREQHPEQEAIR